MLQILFKKKLPKVTHTLLTIAEKLNFSIRIIYLKPNTLA